MWLSTYAEYVPEIDHYGDFHKHNMWGKNFQKLVNIQIREWLL